MLGRKTGNLARDYEKLVEQKRKQAWRKWAATRHWLLGFDITDCVPFAYGFAWGILFVFGVVVTILSVMYD